ncbi:hypothetical protein Hanom_Chr14g01258511 [Helianthus anomalus]
MGLWNRCADDREVRSREEGMCGCEGGICLYARVKVYGVGLGLN